MLKARESPWNNCFLGFHWGGNHLGSFTTSKQTLGLARSGTAQRSAQHVGSINRRRARLWAVGLQSHHAEASFHSQTLTFVLRFCILWSHQALPGLSKSLTELGLGERQDFIIPSELPACPPHCLVGCSRLGSCYFGSVAQSYPILCHPMNCNTPGFPVLHYLPEFAQTHVYWIGNTIQSSWMVSTSWMDNNISVVPLSSCLQSFPASGSFPISEQELIPNHALFRNLHFPGKTWVFVSFTFLSLVSHILFFWGKTYIT